MEQMTIIQRTVVVLIGTQLAASAVILFIFDLNSYNHFSDSFSWHHFLKELIGGFSFICFRPACSFCLSEYVRLDGRRSAFLYTRKKTH